MGGDGIYGDGMTRRSDQRPAPIVRRRPGARRTRRHGGCDPGRPARLSQLRMAQLCPVSQLLRGRLPDRLPWQAWPNIGPFYPYPEVPLDWRAVTLRWDDGIWWLDFKKHYTRPFFTPYPFGLFAY